MEQSNEIMNLKNELHLLRLSFEKSYKELKSENDILKLQINDEKSLIIQKTYENIMKIQNIVNHLDKYYSLDYSTNISKLGDIPFPQDKKCMILKDCGWIVLHGIGISCKSKVYGKQRDLGFNPFCIDTFLKYYPNTIFGNILSMKYPNKVDKVDMTTDKASILLNIFSGHYDSSQKNNIKSKFDITILDVNIKTGLNDYTNMSLFMSETNILTYISNKVEIFLEYFIICVKERDPKYEV